MRIKKNVKRILSFGMATVMAVSLLVTGGGSLGQVEAAATPDVSSAINYTTILGRAVDYGIVSKKFYQNMHMETTLATTDFWNLSGSSCDPDMAGPEPVHYIVGDIHQGALFFNASYQSGPMIANVETTSEVIANSDPNSKTGVYADTGFHGSLEFKTQTKDAISANIDNIVGHGVEESQFLTGKMTEKGVDVETVRDTSSTGKYVIDLTDDSYIGKVVYLNVAADNTDFMTSIAGTGQFEIKKHSDTVVVFNVNAATNTDLDGVAKAQTASNPIEGEDAEQLLFGKHNVYVVEKGIDNAIDTQTHWNGNVDQHDFDVDKEIAQKIIWNLPNASRVSLNTSAGLFIAPKENVLVTLDNQAAGWILANGTVKNNAEFHFVYQGRNASTNTDDDSLFHFSLKKAFTHSYTDVKKDTTFDLDANQYSFALYESVADFSSLGNKVGNNVPNMDTNKVKLPDISITSEGTYYYVIKEETSANVPDGVTISDGEIDIKIVVTKETIAGKEVLYATVDSKYYLTSADKANNKVYKSNTGVEVSGFEFSLGDYFNLLSSSLKVEKKVTGDYNPSSSEKYEIKLKDADDKYYDLDGNVVTGNNAIVEVPANGSVTFENLPNGTYTVEEIEESATRTGYVLNTTYTGNNAIVDGESTPTITVKNDYQETGILTVSKKVTGDNDGAKNQPVEFKIKRTTDDKYVNKDASGNISYVAESGATVFSVTPGTPFSISKLSSGNHVVEEVEPTYDKTKYKLTTTYDPASGVDIDDTSSTPESIEITNNYVAPKGTIVVNKHITIDGKELSYSGGDTISPGQLTPEWWRISNGIGFSISKATGDPITFTYSNMTKGANEGTASKSNEVTLGEYTVAETACPDIEYNGKTYSASTTIDGTAASSKTVNVQTEGDTYTVNIENAYTEKTDDTANLKLLKTATNSTATKFTFYVQGADNKWYKADGTTSDSKVGIEVTAGDTGVTISGIPLQKYTVTEADATTLCDTDHEWDADNSVVTGSATLETKDETKTVTLKNIYKEKQVTPDTANLKLLKTATNSTATKFTFYVQGADNKWYKADGTTSDSKVGIEVTAGDTGVTISGIPLQKYTVTEADATTLCDTDHEWDADNSVVTGSATLETKDETKTVTLKNIYKEKQVTPDTANLKLLKTATNSTATKFTFYVQGADNKWYKADGTTSDSKVGIEVTAGDTGVTISGIPLQKYTVTEADATTLCDTDHEWDADNSVVTGSATLETKDETKTVTLKNIYKEKQVTPDTANLKLLKTATNSTATKFTFYVQGADNKWYKADGTTSDSKVGIEVTAGDTGVTISGIPLQKYTVTEADATTLCDTDHEWDADNSVVTGSATLETKDETKTVTLKNIYKEKQVTPDTANLKLLKTATNSTATKFTFYVQGADNKWYKADGTTSDSKVGIEVTAGDTGVTISGIPLQKYTVTEADATTLCDTDHEWDADNSVVTGSATLETKDETKTVTLKNIYKEKQVTPDTANLKLLKTATNSTATKFTFYVQGADNKWYKADGTTSDSKVGIEVTAGDTGVTISGIPLQKYTVTEADATTLCDTDHEWDADNSVVTGSATLETKDETKTVTLKNIYKEKQVTPDTANLKLLKTATNSTATKFTFYVQGADNKWYKADGTTSDSKVGIEVTAGDTGVTISGIPLQKYTVTEADATTLCDTDHEWDADNSVVTGSATLETKDETKTVTLKNIYKEKQVTPDTANLKLLKTATNSTATKFTFYVQGADNKWYKADGTTSDSKVGIEVTAGDTGVTISGIPLQKYTVTEADATTLCDTDHEWDADNSVVTGNATLETKDETKTVTLKNIYKEKPTAPGSLSVSKTVSGVDDSIVGTSDFTITVTLNDTSISGTYGEATFNSGVATFTLKAGGSKTIDGLPDGVGYTVTEADSSDAYINDNYSFISTVITGETGTIASNVASTASVVNTYKEDTPQPTTGKLTLTKTFGGDVTKEEIESDSITFEVKCGDKWLDVSGQLVDQKTEIKLSDMTPDSTGLKYTINWDNAPIGDYTVTETNKTIYIKENGQKTGIPFTLSKTSKTTDSTSVSATTAGTLELTDNYTKPAVKISKIDATGKQEIEGAELVLYSSDDKGNKTGSTEIKWTSKKTVETFYLEAGTYTIQETVAPSGYEKTTNLFIFKVEYDSTDNDKLVITQLSGDHMPGTYDASTGLISFENDPIKATGGLKITVLEEGTKRVVPNATVEVEAPEGTTFPDGSTKITVVTDTNGQVTKYTGKDGKEYKLTEGLTPGDYKITVTKVPDGYKVTVGKTETVTVKTGEVTEHVALIATSETSKDETPSKEETKPGTPNKDTTKVDTGDHMNVIPIIVIMVISLIASIVVIIRKRKMRYEY